MSLLDKIKEMSKKAAKEFEKADLHTNLDIQSLTREDLLELLPGTENFRLRRTIFGIINEQKSVDALLREVKAFIPHESFRAALTGNGVLVDYLHILKDMKTQMNKVQGFLDAHIDFLEEFSKHPLDEALGQTSTQEPYNQLMPHNASNAEQERGKQGIGTSGASRPLICDSHQTGIGTSSAQDPSLFQPNQIATPSMPLHHLVEHCNHVTESGVTLRYRSVVCRGTFGCHERLMQKVKNQCEHQVQLVEHKEDYWITIVFCPVTTRAGSDAQAAMSDITDDKPIILVLMYHKHEPVYVPEIRVSSFENLVLCVSVLYHEKSGLLTCEQNDAAVSKIQNKLLEYSHSRHPDTTGNDLHVPAESSITAHTSTSGWGGNNSCSSS